MNRLILLFLIILLPVVVFSQKIGQEYETQFMKISINDKGNIVSFYDKSENINYLSDSQPAPLLSIRCNGEIETPSSMRIKGNILTLSYEKNKVVAEVKVTKQKSYYTFELIKLAPSDNVELVIWGPYSTTIKESIGETVGVVHNEKFAIGIQALNIKTLGGYPTEESDVEPSYDITDSTMLDSPEPWRVKRTYRGQTAKLENFGSVIQAYCRNRNKERIISNWNHDHYVAPTFDDGGVKGTKIALFGCPTEKVLETISQIETAEGLPHPLINGKWCKNTPEATSSYLIIDFDENTLDRAIELTKKAGLKYLYQSEPFETWGHFVLNRKEFPDNRDGLKKCVEKAEKQGVFLGVHMLSNFITTNDSYVTPVPDKRLAKVGASVLAGNINATDKEITVMSPMFFNQMKNNTLHAAVIGNEIIRYQEVSGAEPWVLKSCIRGAYGTTPSAHSKGDTIAKLMDHDYKTFLTDSKLSEEVAGNLADLFNYTGIRQTSFDGLEGNWSTGMGQYGCQLFVKTWYDKLAPQLKNNIINDASMPGHFNWHINTRYNWGEPWYAGFRESQQETRLKNQDYFRRNFLPAMLGWFRMTDETSTEDVEWLLARAAGFDAGFSFCIDLKDIDKNGKSNEILEYIKQWEDARLSGAFNHDQKLGMENINNEFHLEAGGLNSWMLYPYNVKRYQFENKVKQPGEPKSDNYEFDNPFKDQIAQFILKLLPENNSRGCNVSSLTIEINNSEVEIPVKIEPFQILAADGSDSLKLYDRNWNLIKEIKVDSKSLMLLHGNNSIVFNADFEDNTPAEFRIEIKTKGEAEIIGGTNKK